MYGILKNKGQRSTVDNVVDNGWMGVEGVWTVDGGTGSSGWLAGWIQRMTKTWRFGRDETRQDETRGDETRTGGLSVR